MDDLLRQIKSWNDNDEFSKCIAAIEAIAPEKRGYLLTLLLGRAYSNLAVLGDGGKLVDSDVIDGAALAKALEILESIQEEGCNDPHWNSRMAYALYMAKGRIDEALHYARRWAHLAPENSDAAKLVSDCEQIIASETAAASETDDTARASNITVAETGFAGAALTYTLDELRQVEAHIEKYFGKVGLVLHEKESPDIHLDIFVLPPRPEHDYYTLVTCGMGAYRMALPEKEDACDRAELLLNLPKEWPLTQDALKDLQEDKYYWPIGVLKQTARMPLTDKLWFSWGHTIGFNETLAEDTQLCGAALLDPGVFGNSSYDCSLEDGGNVHFYQLIPLYQEEIDFKIQHGMDKLLEKCDDDLLEVINPKRLNAIVDAAVINHDDALMESAEDGIKLIRERKMPVDELNAYTHLAIYLRWCIENSLMGNPFVQEYAGVVADVQNGYLKDLRSFLRDDTKLCGKLKLSYFDYWGTHFARWYSWGSRATPYAYLKDVEEYAAKELGDRYAEEGLQGCGYLLIAWSEKYYQDIAAIITRRFNEWSRITDSAQAAKQFSLEGRTLHNFLPCWKGARMCFISDQVIFEDKPIRWFFREEPDAGDEGWDSGWWFLSGDEMEECMDDGDNFGLYDLNVACNCAPGIIPFLEAPFGSEFERQEDGAFVELKAEQEN